MSAVPSAVTPADAVNPGDIVLSVNDLSVRFPSDEGPVNAVQNLSYNAYLGRTLAIVGESGSGKSVSSLTVLGLHNAKRAMITGSVKLEGTEIVGAPEDTMRGLRSKHVAMVFQDPLSALHPFYKVGRQIAEAYLAHNKVSKSVAHKRAVEMLDRVGIPNPDRRADQFPHEFSGGMRQRAMIALGLVNDPKLLIADEPTTALDVTVQAQILDLMADLQREFGSAIILITHDLGVVAEVADDILVMYAGRAVETGPCRDVLAAPKHPYTWGLLQSIPSASDDVEVLHSIKGAPPSLVNLPSGCSFHPRCRFRELVGIACTTELPLLRENAPGRRVRCHLADPDAAFEQEEQA